MKSVGTLCPFSECSSGLIAVWEITRSCNLRCRHCLVDGGNGSHSTLNLNRTIDSLVELNTKEVLITGGEPLLHPEIFRISSLLSKAGLRVGICTNGTLIDREAASCLKDSGIGYIILSLDGSTSETHELIRRGQPSFAAACSAAEILSAVHISVDFTMTVGLHNAHEAGGVVELAAQLAAGSMTFTPILPIGRGAKAHDILISDDYTLQKTAGDIENAAQKQTHLHVERVRLPLPRERKLVNFQCPLSSQLFLGTEGQIGTCAWMASVGLGMSPPGTGDIPLLYKRELEKINHQLSNRKKNKGCPLAAILAGRGLSGLDPLLDSIRSVSISSQ